MTTTLKDLSTLLLSTVYEEDFYQESRLTKLFQEREQAIVIFNNP